MLFSASAIAWFIIPQFLIDNKLLNPIIILIKNLETINYNIVINNFFTININLSYILFLVPIISIFKVISIFLRKKIPFLCTPDRIISVFLNILSSSLIISAYIYYLLKYASNIKFFYVQDLKFYISACIVVIFNLIFIYLFLKALIKMDKAYKDFLLFKKSDKHDKKNIKFFLGIQKKLIFSILITIIVVISVLSFFILKDYKMIIINGVENTGEIIAQESASYFKENYNDVVSINYYLNKQKERNNEIKLKFETLSLFKKRGKEELYITENTTNEEYMNKILNQNEVKLYSSITLSQKFYNKTDGIINFVAPIRLKDKILGFSILIYKEDVIYESFFKAQIRVILLTALFIYISFVLIYIIGNRIVFPLLFLRMNVKKISNSLQNMISGDEKVSSLALNFDDEIKTRDEIKALSKEINNMTTVIKGIIPYVSVSTFKQAHKDETKIVLKNLAFLFTDIRGFTTICEGLQPKEIIEMINHYLEVQTEIILRNNGDIDKFVGDEVMATFDGANKELNACNASMELIEMMQLDKKEREEQKLPTVSIGIGVNSGPVVFGSIGAKERMDYTSIGDTVNLAARLEGANKTYNTKTLISENVYKKIEDKFICREIDLITVIGKTESIRVYEILQKKEKTEKKINYIKLNFEKGLSAYRSQNWDEALKYFQKNLKEFNDETSKVFINRIIIFKNNPPPKDWDGVFSLEYK